MIHKLLFTLFIFLSLSDISIAQTTFDYFLRDNDRYQDVIVDTIITTDTIILRGGEKIKLIGLRAPDPPKVDRHTERDEYGFMIKNEADPVTPIEERALEFIKELLEGKHVRLEMDDVLKNKENQTLAYVFLLEDNTFVNAEVLRNGFAYLQLRPPNMKYAAQLREAYRESRRELRGLQGE